MSITVTLVALLLVSDSCSDLTLAINGSAAFALGSAQHHVRECAPNFE